MVSFFSDRLCLLQVANHFGQFPILRPTLCYCAQILLPPGAVKR